ncbi:hypothetical protein ACH5RR_022643 [Cinchona calisaya]|uniref:DUF659 domain-containing protein n=1 Tax=Cinchona calisaya TaxID=153742 RepID=A0ABD2ZA83_9GENT
MVTKKRSLQERLKDSELHSYNLREYEEKLCMQDEVEIREIQSIPTSKIQKEKKLQEHKKGKTIGTMFMPITPSIKSVFQVKEAKEKVDLAIAKWMIDASIPFNAANFAYYQKMFDAASSFGAGYKAPNFCDLHGYLLTKNVEHVKNFVDSFRSTCKETGCTFMADGWTDQQRRTLINFLSLLPKRNSLFKIENVVHIMTDKATNYAIAGRLLEREFHTLYWFPCAAQCLNLMLQDIGKLEEVSNIVSHASKITKYVYNHCYPLYFMRRHTGGKEIIHPAPTQFATNFIAFANILMQKDALRAMVTSKEWTFSAYTRESKGKKFVDLVLDSMFQKECATIVQVTEPLVRVLRLVDSDERPSMGWDSQLHKNLQVAGFWINLAYHYNSLDISNHKHTTSGLLDVIERCLYGNPILMSNLTREMKLFRKTEGDFGRVSAIRDRDVMLPGRNYDPIDFEEFGTSDTWVLEDEPPNLTEA